MSDTINIKLDCTSTLGRRKVSSLDLVHPSVLSITLCPYWSGLKANCWLKDNDGRELGLVLNEDALKSLHSAIDKALYEQKKIAR